MNLFPQILPFIVLVGLPIKGAAQLGAGPDAAGGRVSNFEAVSKQLETGGTVYAYLDLEGDAEALGEFGNVLVSWGREQSGGALPPGLSAPGLIRALGLDRVKAVGFSSRPIGNGMFHNRGVLHMPEGRSGIFNLMGGPAAPFRSPALAPAGSDWVMESDLTLGAALELTESVVKSLGNPQWLHQYQMALGFPMPGLEMTIKDFVERLNTRVIIAGSLLEGKTFQPPGSGAKLPCFQTLISFEGMDFLFPRLLELMESTGKSAVERGAGYVKIRQAEPNTGELEFLQPVIHHDPAGGRILLASHPEILKKWLTPGEKLEGSPRFKAAMAGLPGEGNELTYVTPAVIETLKAAFGGGLRQSLQVPWASGAGAGADSLISLLWEEWRRQNPAAELPVAAVRANQPTGMTFHSNVAGSNKFVLAAAGLSLPVAVGLTGVMGIGKKQTSAAPIVPGPGAAVEAGNPDQNEKKDAEKGVPGAVRANLKQISFAAATWFLGNPGATEVTYEKLVEENLLFPIPAVATESYKGLKLERAGGSLILQLEDGIKVEFEYPAVPK